MFYGAAVGASAARYFASLSTKWYFDDNKLTSTNFSKRERALDSIMGCCQPFFLNESVGLAGFFPARS